MSYEFQVSKPRVILKEIDGVMHEPVGTLRSTCRRTLSGRSSRNWGAEKRRWSACIRRERLYPNGVQKVPSRGIIGYRTEFLTDTKGNGIMNSVICGFEPFAGEIETRSAGVLIAFEGGEAMTYGLYNAQERGFLMIGPGTQVYEE